MVARLQVSSSVFLGAGYALAFVHFLSLGRVAGLALEERRNWHVLVPHLIGIDHLRYPIQDILLPFLFVAFLPLEGPFLLNRLGFACLGLWAISDLTFLPILLPYNDKRVILSWLYLHFLPPKLFFDY